MSVEPVTGPALDTAEDVAAHLTAATRRAFEAESASRQREPHHLGLSGVGGCRRAAAYALSKTPVSDEPGPEEGRAANLGTWEHAGLLPRLAEQLPGARVEVPVNLSVCGLDLTGHVDLLWPVIGPVDLKTVGEHRLSGVRRTGGAYPDHLLQVFSYALALWQGGEKVRYVAWHYLDRATGDEAILVLPFTNAHALAVIDRVEELISYAVEDPDEAPRDERGPGLSFSCDRCPWLRRCWGDDAVPGRRGAQAILVRDNADVIEALDEYDDARARASQAAKDKEFAAAKLDLARFSTYGPAPGRPEVAFKLSRDRDGTQLDQKAARELIKRLGHEPPLSTRRGSLRVQLVKMPQSDTPES